MNTLFSLDKFKGYKASWKEEGSMTVELSLIFPLVIITILFVIYIVILLYQLAFLQSTVNHVTKAASRNWGRIDTQQNLHLLLETGEVNNKNYQHPLYWRFTVIDQTTMKENYIGEYIKGKLTERTVLKPVDSQITVKYKDQILYREILVDANITYEIPIPLLKEVLGLGRGYTARISSKAVIKDHAETIRTIDLINDLMEETEVTRSIKDQYNEILIEVKEKISVFFE
ncbi:TadE family protein [Alkaliphilus transvaalensis]|uniref:TadE family protein n=1 Tax=Alkaliphilus transvaalensis TaxID=114628 RepID=UPI00047B65DB|nr:TadE family protein [Alkaliphilus transvaalensis]